jgi:hypothetical protein
MLPDASDFSSLEFGGLVSFRIFKNCSKFASVVLQLLYGQKQEFYLSSSSKIAKFSVVLSNKTRRESLESTNSKQKLIPGRNVTVRLCLRSLLVVSLIGFP